MRRWLTVLVITAIALYGTLGVAYHRVSKACWESRHAEDEEGEVFGGGVGVAIDLLLWPVFLTADGLTGVSCQRDG